MMDAYLLTSVFLVAVFAYALYLLKKGHRE